MDRFDWYQATIPEKPIVLIEEFLRQLAPGGEVLEGRGLHNYHQGFRILDSAGHEVAQVLAGGKNGDPNAKASGPATDAFVRVVRECWPVHRVTRVDSCADMVQEGAYDTLEATCRAVARDAGVKGRAIVPDDPADGRTYYLGSNSSDVRTRLYDKTAEQRRSLPESRHSEVPEYWARLESQVRPRKESKAVFASLSPAQVWGAAGWSAELARRVFSLNVERVMMQSARETDHERAWRFMLQQYGGTLYQAFRDLGSWDCVGRTIGDELEQLAEVKRLSQ